MITSFVSECLANHLLATQGEIVVEARLTHWMRSFTVAGLLKPNPGFAAGVPPRQTISFTLKLPVWPAVIAPVAVGSW